MAQRGLRPQPKRRREEGNRDRGIEGQRNGGSQGAQAEARARPPRQPPCKKPPPDAKQSVVCSTGAGPASSVRPFPRALSRYYAVTLSRIHRSAGVPPAPALLRSAALVFNRWKPRTALALDEETPGLMVPGVRRAPVPGGGAAPARTPAARRSSCVRVYLPGRGAAPRGTRGASSSAPRPGSGTP